MPEEFRQTLNVMKGEMQGFLNEEKSGGKPKKQVSIKETVPKLVSDTSEEEFKLEFPKVYESFVSDSPHKRQRHPPTAKKVRPTNNKTGLHRRRRESSSSSSSDTEGKYWRSSRFNDNRQAPKLERFNEESGQSLSEYFNRFESYCKSNYKGGKKFWLAILQDHLEGRILDTFQHYYDQFSDYVDVKQKLIKWHEDNEDLRRKRYKRKFENARPKNKESLYMFSLRLESLFKKAYPRKNVRKSRKLMDQFKHALPRKVRNDLKYQITSLKLKNEEPEWSFYQECVKIQDLDSDYEQENSSEDETDKEVIINLAQNEGKQEKKNFYSSRISFNNSCGPSRKGRCFTCGNTGHYARECRWNLGLCIACGCEGHFIRDCPKKYRNDNPRSYPNRKRDYNRVNGEERVKYGEKPRNQQQNFRNRSISARRYDNRQRSYSQNRYSRNQESSNRSSSYNPRGRNWNREEPPWNQNRLEGNEMVRYRDAPEFSPSDQHQQEAPNKKIQPENINDQHLNW